MGKPAAPLTTPKHPRRLDTPLYETCDSILAMRYLIIAILLLFSPALAGEKSPLLQELERMPPLPQDIREKFDKAATSMYRESCQCLTYMHIASKTVRRVNLPMDDTDRRLLIEAIKRGLIVPFGPGGQGS